MCSLFTQRIAVLKQDLFLPPLQRYGQTEHDYARELILLHQEAHAYQFLVDKPFLAKTKDDHGYTLMHHAASEGLINILELLLSFGAEPYASDPEHHCPLHWAIERNQIQVLDFYLKSELWAPKHKVYQHPLRSPFCLTIQLASVPAAKKCLALGFKGSSAQVPHDWAWAELSRLSRKNQWGYRAQKPLSTQERIETLDEFATLFLEHGLSPLDQNQDGFNAFLWAAQHQNILLMQWFFAAEAHLGRALWQPLSFSPLMLCARNNTSGTLSFLLDHWEQYDPEYFLLDVSNALILSKTHSNFHCVSLLEHKYLELQVPDSEHEGAGSKRL